MKKKFRPAKMVNWFDPQVLIQTGIRSWVSSTFGNYADRREMEAILDKDLDPNSFLKSIPNQEDQEKAQKDRYWTDTQNQDEIWLDFISDSGDGFDSTYAVAFAAAQSELHVKGLGVALPRADIVILGGDQVYPSPTKDAYDDKFRIPFESAVYIEHQESALRPEQRGAFYPDIIEKIKYYDWGFPNDIRGLIEEENSKKHRYLFAIPGNHDWYDGLGNFMKVFCQQRWIADWETRQTRSYFAFKLPHNYWIWASDIQLNAEIDMPQLEYFKTVAKEQMYEGDKIILLTAEPAWVYKQLHKNDSSFDKLMFFIDKQINRKGIDACELELPLVLTGDLHHYSRYATRDPDIKSPQFIGAGGGGAFLHLTHNLPQNLDKPDSKNLELKASYPSKKDSLSMLRFNLAFFCFNPSFSFGLFGALYVLILWLLQSHSLYVSESGYLNDIASASFHKFLSATWQVLIVSPFLFLLTAGLLAGLTFFADTKTKTSYVHIYSFFMAVLQVSAIYLTIWWLASVQQLLLPNWWMPLLLALQLMLVGGVAGGFIMGFYLYLTNRFSAMHFDESSSSLASPHYKNFLRLRISSEGITIYPIGIKKVDKMSAEGQDGEILFSSKVPQCELIEEPIFIKSNQP